MENFIVSARKYRPAIFDTVVGQSPITATLKNSIKSNHLAQAYLFCGPRGVGKTTCARIFAKTINCQNISADLEACNECESCKAFNKSTSYNIHELDAASNNSVDDIRLLIDQVRIPPQVGKYSIYIIDEVHMLSQQAFNAFLKTLEEPPAHAIFILATTEKHKIIPTILSRCQIFDFNRISIKDISDYLQYVAKKEKVVLDEDAANVIALKADGAMRDALSIFDQIVSFAGNEIAYKDVIANLNVLDYDYYFKLTDAFISADISGALLILDEILYEGFDGHNFITNLSSHFRDLLVCREPETLKLLEVGATIKERYGEQAMRVSPDFIFDALKITSGCDLNFKASQNKRLHLEIALIQLCNIVRVPSEQKVVQESKPIKTAAPIVQKTVVEEPVKGTKAEEPAREEVKKEQKAPAAYRSTPSIKSTTKPKEVKEEVVVEKAETETKPEEIGEESFDEERLMEAWKSYTEKIVDKPRLFNMILNSKPVIEEDVNVMLQLNTQLQEDSFNEIRNQMTKFLQKELNNKNLNIITSIAEDKEDKKIYTDRDKLEFLKEQNPNVAKLQQKLNLDF